MIEDLSTRHQPITSLFKLPNSREESMAFCLSEDQVAFYKEHGYVAGIRMLSDEQIEVLREELATLTDPPQEAKHLFYEYHSNESPDPATTLFHALGAWRISQAFHDLLWNPAFTVPASQLLEGPVRFWHDQLFCKPPRHGAWPGIRITCIGLVRSRWRTLAAGSGWTTRLVTTVACIMFRAVNGGTFCRSQDSLEIWKLSTPC